MLSCVSGMKCAGCLVVYVGKRGGVVTASSGEDMAEGLEQRSVGGSKVRERLKAVDSGMTEWACMACMFWAAQASTDKQRHELLGPTPV